MARKKSRDSEDDRSLSREKRDLIGYHLPLDSVDGTFDDYGEYLRADTTLCLDFIQDLKELLADPNRSRRESISSRYREKFDRLDELKNDSEEETGKYPITEFFEENSFTRPERTVIRLLLATNGIGVQTGNTYLTGEEIMVSLNLLHDVPVEESRKIIMRPSKLHEKRCIGFTSRTVLELESSKMAISERSISTILSEVERVEKIKEEDRNDDGAFPLAGEKKSESNLLVKEEPRYDLDDVVLPSQIKESILSILDQYKEKEKFYEDWNMKSVVGEGTGINLLFSGPSGTGKTMCAKAIGKYSDKEVRYVAFDNLLSSYYAGSERRIGRLFKEIKNNDYVVIIDEADGLLNRRGLATDSADSTENRVVDLFLRELEKHQKIVLLTSNFTESIDPAVNRRLDLSIEFPFPDEKARRKIWQTHIPDELPLSDEVDFDRLAEKKLSGGEIKNAVVNAARKAISDGKEKVAQKHFEYGAKLEMNSAMEYSLHDDGRLNEESKMGYV